MRSWSNVGLLVGQRRRRWANSKPMLGQRLMFAGLRQYSESHHESQNDF